MKTGIKLSIIVLLALSQSSYATDENDWSEILSGVKDSQTGQQGYLYDTNVERMGTLYNSSVVYQFRGGDGDGDFGASEAVRLAVTIPGRSNPLITQNDAGGEYLTPAELSSWADKHADELLKAVFGTDPSATVSGTTTSVATVSNEIVEQVSTSKQQKKTKNDKAKSFDTDFSSLVVMDSEKASMDSNGISGSSSAFKFSYDKEVKNGNDVGALFSYRKTKASDVYGSKATSMLLSPYYKYYYTLNDKIEVIGVGNLVLGSQEMKSSLFNNFGYYEYGAGLSAIPSYYVNDKLSFSLPLGVQTLKKKIEGGAPESIDFIVDAINNLGFQNSVNYGLGAEYAIKPNWYVNLDALQTKELGADASNTKDTVTYYNLRTTYYGELWNYALGYKTVKNIANYSEDAYMVSVQYNW